MKKTTKKAKKKTTKKAKKTVKKSSKPTQTSKSDKPKKKKLGKLKKFRYLPHTADIQFQAFGSTKAEVFENSALAMFNAMSHSKVKEKLKRKIAVKGKDNESLLYNFLEELLFLFDSQYFFLSKIKNIRIEKNMLVAEVIGDKAGKYDIRTNVKAITYNEMIVKKLKPGLYVTQVVLDV